MQGSLQETCVLLYLDLVMNVVGMYVWALWICTRTWSEFLLYYKKILLK